MGLINKGVIDIKPISRTDGAIQAIGAGAILLDNMIEVVSLPQIDTLPYPGQKLQTIPGHVQSVLGSISDKNHPAGKQKIKRQMGGPAITAITVYRDPAWGASIPIFCCAIGDDTIGAKLVKRLEKAGVYPLANFQDNRRSGQSVVWVRRGTGERSILYDRGSLKPVRRKVREKFIDQIERYEVIVKPAKRIVHLDASDPGLVKEFGTYFHGQDGIVYLDTGDFKTYKDQSTTKSLMTYADVVQMPLRCAREMYVRECNKLNIPMRQLTPREYAEYFCAQYDDKLFIVTDGINGAGFSYMEKSKMHSGHVDAFTGHIDGFPDRIKDETSAGDIFAGTMGAALISGHNIHASLKIASVAAASSVRHLGNSTFLGREEAARLSQHVGLIATQVDLAIDR